ncbi:MAG TPA: methyl-accepting chemotaxis protein [Rhodocyclaceae bacterium]|nr:methyl-accepting chemotaxis protein [Rhodocyclaceae bacterium]
MSLKSLPVLHRLILILFAAFVGTLTLGAVALYEYRVQMDANYGRAVRQLVETAHGVVAHYHALEASGRLPRADAQEAAKQTLRALRYDEAEYFWINDSGTISVMHPIRPELEGRDLRDVQDPNGKYMFREFASVAREHGEGFVDYLWPKPGASAPQPKISYVKLFEPWGWIVGSGVYTDDIDAAFTSHLYRFLGVVLLVMAVLSLLAWRIVRSITSQLGGEPAYAAQIMQRVAQGDLQVAVQVARGDRGSLLGALADMLVRLRAMMREIGGSAEQVAGSSHHISGVARGVAEAAHSQADAASAIAAAVEQMTVSINHISDNARETERNSSEAAQLAEKGEQRAGHAVSEMGGIAVTVDQASEKIQQLVARADEIGSIAHVIKEIAAQTNLLALNAAIEAARAGEQGRGFAVVADEVRGLAERTAQATVQIEQMVGSIQTETQAAVTEMARVAQRVQAGVGMVRGAAESLGEIRGGTEVALARIRDVSNATTEQSAASTSIAQRVEHIAQMVEETSVSMRSTVDAVGELEALAAQLREMIGRFRY